MATFKNTTALAAMGIGISVSVYLIKMLAYYVSGSVTLQADAAESIINIVAAICGTVALWYAVKPADNNHHYGHHKIEHIAASIEGVFILCTAFSIGYSLIQDFKNPHPLTSPITGVCINLLGTLLNLGWALVLMKLGKRNKSPALISNAQHLMSDVWTGGALVLGVLLIPLTHLDILDEIIGAIVVLMIVKSGWDVVCASLSGLTDEAPSESVMQKIKTIIATKGVGAIEAHHLRTRCVGPVTFLDFHLVVDGDMSVRRAHEICDVIEHALKTTMGNVSVSIHVEPESHKEASRDSLQIK